MNHNDVGKLTLDRQLAGQSGLSGIPRTCDGGGPNTGRLNEQSPSDPIFRILSRIAIAASLGSLLLYFIFSEGIANFLHFLLRMVEKVIGMAA